MKLLNEIQQKLKAPKGQFNAFGKYKYRSCEDILEAVKPLLGKAILVISDNIVQVGDRYYVKAVVQLKDGDEIAESIAFARESLAKKGMDESQITGTASSYARKYALNGLFLIDDTKDADTQDNSEKPKDTKPKPKKPTKKQMEIIDKVAITLEEDLDGKGIDRGKLTGLLFAQTGRYPTDEKTILTIAAWIIGNNWLNQLIGE